MTEQNGNGDLIAKLAKYGVGSVIALYLTFYLAHTVTGLLHDILKAQDTQTEILSDIRYTLKAQAGISFRNNATTEE